jgi:dienelactone hydrolase
MTAPEGNGRHGGHFSQSVAEVPVNGLFVSFDDFFLGINMYRFFTTLSLLLLASAAVAQEAAKRPSGDDLIAKYLGGESDRLSQKFLGGAKTIDEWKENRPRLQREFLDMLGLWPLPDKTPLYPTITNVHETHGVVIENVHFQSKPGLYVTANLYRPKVVDKKLPAIVYACGHSGRGRDGNKTAFQDHGFWFANNGYVCIVLDTLELGEIPGAHLGTYGRPFRHLKTWGIDDPERSKNQNRFWWYSAGYTPAGVECWNGVRAIDYLVSRPEVDPERIGVTGISGGGAATFWIAGADDRVKVAVPVSGMGDLQFYVKEKGVNNHCDCMFFYNTYQWDWTTIAALVAPRPMLFANSDKDIYFPMGPNRRVIVKLRQVYDLYGRPDVLDEYVSSGSHDYRPDLRIPVFKFINKHLKGDANAAVEDSAKYTPIDAKRLRVFPTDADIPKGQVNMSVDEVFVQTAKRALPEKEKFEEWRKAKLLALEERVLGVQRSPIPKAVFRKGEQAFLQSVETEPGISTWLFDAGGGSTLFVMRPNDKKSHLEWNQWMAKTFPDDFPWIYGPRGVVEPLWTNPSPPNLLERRLILVGRTIDQQRTLDVLGTVRGFEKEPIRKLMGSGPAGIWAAYAALFEPSVKEVVLIDPPTSHKDGPHYPSVLRVIDIPEALGLLAPRPLTIIGNDPAFDRTAEIYRLAGAADKLTRK